jgi:hypothetical protein
MDAPLNCLAVEIWQDILLLAIESDEASVFAATCTPSTFLHFIKREGNPDYYYIEYMKRREMLRQVCRAWNQFLLPTSSWWTHIRRPHGPQQPLDLPHLADDMPTVKRLSMTLSGHECVGPGLTWTSDLLQRVRVPPISYNLTISPPPDHFCISHDLAAIGPRTTLRSLRVACPTGSNCVSLSFPRLSANFKELVSLSLVKVTMYSTEELTLPRLEFLYIYKYNCSGMIPLPTQRWNLPRLRHVFIAIFSSESHFYAVLDFLRRYGSQLESLVMLGDPCPCNLPHDFWDSFTALQLLGVLDHVLENRRWSGWTITPPRIHPFKYLVGNDCISFRATVESLRSTWTYHEEVVLVMEYGSSGEYYLIEDIKEGWRSRMTKTNGILPMHPQALNSYNL